MTPPSPARPARRPRAHPPAPRQALDQPYRILVRGLAARTIIGVQVAERRKRQDVVIDLDLRVESRAGQTDRIEDAVLHLAETSRFHLVEALAEAIAGLCLRQPGVASATVTVDKLGALRFARSVAVQVQRERAMGGGAAGAPA